MKSLISSFPLLFCLILGILLPSFSLSSPSSSFALDSAPILTGAVPYDISVDSLVSLHRRSSIPPPASIDATPDLYDPSSVALWGNGHGLVRRDGFFEGIGNFFKTVGRGARKATKSVVSFLKKHKGALIGLIVTIVVTVGLSFVVTPVIAAAVGGFIGMDVQQAIEKNQTTWSSYWGGALERLPLNLFSAALGGGVTAAMPLLGRALSMGSSALSKPSSLALKNITPAGGAVTTTPQQVMAKAAAQGFKPRGGSVAPLVYSIEKQQAKLLELSSKTALTRAERATAARLDSQISANLQRLAFRSGAPGMTRAGAVSDFTMQLAFGLPLVTAFCIYSDRKQQSMAIPEGIQRWGVTKSSLVRIPYQSKSAGANGAPTYVWYAVPTTGLSENSTAQEAQQFNMRISQGGFSALPPGSVRLDDFPSKLPGPNVPGNWSLDQKTGVYVGNVGSNGLSKLTIMKDPSKRASLIVDSLGNQIALSDIPTRAANGTENGITFGVRATSVVLTKGRTVTWNAVEESVITMDSSGKVIPNVTDQDGVLLHPNKQTPTDKSGAGTAGEGGESGKTSTTERQNGAGTAAQAESPRQNGVSNGAPGQGAEALQGGG
ncbi:MAG: hypothetical protein DHS80DRAFT_26294 [Piptocephalis tieghemiana]|nr:MAG: hypothetical protein DHS80DRAFT_26294 [Piptocephalis tieghemiana]